MKRNLNYPCDHRNDQLLKLFSNLGFQAKLIGDRNQPKIIINDDFAISGFVQNRLYHFTTKPFNGDKVRTINLNEPDITKEEIEEIFKDFEQRKLFKISCGELFYLKTENNIPLFSNIDCRYYFFKQRAIDTQNYLKEAYGLETKIKSSKNNFTIETKNPEFE